MKFEVGKAAYDKYMRTFIEWKEWYAWYPVKTGRFERRWLEVVERKREECEAGIDSFSYWTYRPNVLARALRENQRARDGNARI